LFEDGSQHLMVPVRLKSIRVERARQFGDVYLALALCAAAGLPIYVRSSCHRATALSRLAARIERSRTRLDPTAINRQIGRLLHANQRAAARFDVRLVESGSPAGFHLHVARNTAFDDWAALSEGAYLLRSNHRMAIPLVGADTARHDGQLGAQMDWRDPSQSQSAHRRNGRYSPAHR
jgi:hypothetical protein